MSVFSVLTRSNGMFRVELSGEQTGENIVERAGRGGDERQLGDGRTAAGDGAGLVEDHRLHLYTQTDYYYYSIE